MTKHYYTVTVDVMYTYKFSVLATDEEDAAERALDCELKDADCIYDNAEVVDVEFDGETEDNLYAMHCDDEYDAWKDEQW